MKPMDAFQRSKLKKTYIQTLAAYLANGVERAEAEKCAQHLHRCEVWLNDTYQVLIDKSAPHGFGEEIKLWYLSIRRLDREPIHDWRHLQQIKSELCGPESEGIELYPAESRVVDGANQYHMHVVVGPDGFRFPVGFFPPRAARGGPEKAAKLGAKQRPL